MPSTIARGAWPSRGVAHPSNHTRCLPNAGTHRDLKVHLDCVLHIRNERADDIHRYQRVSKLPDVLNVPHGAKFTKQVDIRVSPQAGPESQTGDDNRTLTDKIVTQSIGALALSTWSLLPASSVASVLLEWHVIFNAQRQKSKGRRHSANPTATCRRLGSTFLQGTQIKI